MQAIEDHAPKANWYFSVAFDVYASLWYHWDSYAVSEAKTDTSAVEGNSAELRHYLARLARLFVYYFNQHQLRKRLFPKYPFYIIDFVHSPI